jgi:O-antigen/teichoic acid export membrane protein
MAIASFIAPLAVLFVALRPDRETASIALIVGLGNVAANVILLPTFGMEGAATTTIASYVTLGAYYLLRLREGETR